MNGEVDTVLAIDNVHPALGACYHPVCRSDDLADGGVLGVRSDGDDIVILQARYHYG